MSISLKMTRYSYNTANYCRTDAFTEKILGALKPSMSIFQMGKNRMYSRILLSMGSGI